MSTRDKIKSLSELAEIVKYLKERKKIIVQCHGCFDLMHPGHIKHFEAAKKLGDVLVVTVTADKYVNKGPGRPVFNQQLRTESIAALGIVDFVALNQWPNAVEMIKVLKPNFFVKDKEVDEAKDDPNTNIGREKIAVESVGGKLYLTDVYYLTNETKFNSSTLLNEYFGGYPETVELFLKNFRKKHSASDIEVSLKRIKKLKVLVIGDTIIDNYQYVTGLGRTPKIIHLVTKYIEEEIFAGGIIACANHIAGFCDNVDLITCLGNQKSYEEFIREHLKGNINAKFFYRDDSPTTLKRRFVESVYMEKIFEINFLNDSDLPVAVAQEVLAYLANRLDSYDLVIVADYGHGFLVKDIVDFLISHSKFLALNVQTNSANYGFNLVIKYARADYISITEQEMRIALHSKTGKIESLIREISRKSKAERIAVTSGHKGCMLFSKKEGFFEIPALSKRVVDTTGAGDAFFIVSAPWAALKMPTDLVGFIGNVAGAIKVGTICNKFAVDSEQFKIFIEHLLK